MDTPWEEYTCNCPEVVVCAGNLFTVIIGCFIVSSCSILKLFCSPVSTTMGSACVDDVEKRDIFPEDLFPVVSYAYIA